VLCYGVCQMAGSGKENGLAEDKCPDVSPMASVSLCSTDVNVDDSSPVLVLSFSSSQSGIADADVPVPSSRHAPVFGSTSLLTGAVGARDLASGITRFVHGVIDQLFKPHHSTGY